MFRKLKCSKEFFPPDQKEWQKCDERVKRRGENRGRCDTKHRRRETEKIQRLFAIYLMQSF